MNIITPKPAILDIPSTSSMGKLDNSIPEKIDPQLEKLIIDPTKRQEKSAHTMLVIRRRKMNKHKRKKRLRKYKFLIAKRFREKRMNREVAFRIEIAAKLREAEQFNAEAYVADKLAIYRKELLPFRLHGKVMPAFVIEEWVQKKKTKKECLEKLRERRKKFADSRGGTLDVDVKS